jgi:hypothetical protein
MTCFSRNAIIRNIVRAVARCRNAKDFFCRECITEHDDRVPYRLPEKDKCKNPKRCIC